MKTYPKARVVLALAALLVCAALPWTAAMADAVAFDPAHPGYDALLKRFVVDGRVDYQGLRNDRAALDRYLDGLAGISEATFSAWPASERLAFLINLYNAATLKLIIDHYPITRIKDIGSIFKGPWAQPVVRHLGQTITLDTLEHGLVRKQYGEPRIHLALVCAAKSCPPLRSEAYVADRLDAQLDDQSQRFLASPAGLRIDRGGKTVYFSSIFKWYGQDFVDRFSPATGFPGLDPTERAVAHFCSGYLSAADGDYLKAGAYSVKYMDYDWALNAK
jgi:hypothetical protein